MISFIFSILQHFPITTFYYIFFYDPLFLIKHQLKNTQSFFKQKRLRMKIAWRGVGKQQQTNEKVRE